MTPEKRALATLMTLMLTDEEHIKKSGQMAAQQAGVWDSAWLKEVWYGVIEEQKLFRHSRDGEVGWQITEAGLRFIENGGKS